MLLNLTNHPVKQWGEKQLKAATERYGSVEDMAFPSIAPMASSEEVEALARTYAEQIATLRPQAVHLMGEMTFTCYLVSLLQRTGIACIASTSERLVLEEADGKKTIVFDFQQFRAYPQLV